MALTHLLVMAGLDPAIHEAWRSVRRGRSNRTGMDGRVEPGHDEHLGGSGPVSREVALGAA